MAYFPAELAIPPAITIGGAGGAVLQQKQGTGYPTGGSNSYYPNVPAVPPVPTNPHGRANTPDENPAIIAAPPGVPFSYAYSFQTFEEKIAGTGYVPCTVLDIDPNEPYPES